MPDRIRTELEVLDERFRRCDGDAWTQRLFTGCRWAEGPAYFPAGRYLVFSDIPNDRILRFDELTGMVGEFRAPAGYANGHTVDRQGRLISCEHGNRQVTRTEPDGSITVLASHYEGKRLNSPNDVVERSDGSVWFTDPSYGIDSDYEGHKAPSEIGACHVYRVAPETGEVRIAADGFLRPNGLAFSADERQLYIVDTRKKHIRLFDVASDGALVRRGSVRHLRRGILRRHPARRHRPGLGRRPRWGPLLPPRRRPARQAAHSGGRLQPHLRRPQT